MVVKNRNLEFCSSWLQESGLSSRSVFLLTYLIVGALVFAVLIYFKWDWLMTASLAKEQAAFWDTAIKAFGGAVAIAGAIIGFSKYFFERAKENQAALIEAQKPFFAKRQEVYFQLVSAASTIANRMPDESERVNAEVQFWWLYWGGIPMVADDDVGRAVDIFSEVLHRDPTHADPTQGELLRNSAMNLARACRRSLRFIEY